ncbi:hypothetical protein PAXRUDRAFT_14596 [Paxillus rubicundulus Ve08.2h10]|uniref:BRCT domain-containing protein n=1 Tax=Paxillus rubicundulus Ve08.2h10 TaxID=930991 RepID=A0A0D0D5E1_9AGAM|nr:hypothetical protein PAXRUDRAFT_14596 [Paxillus rubicundulus Ve08.2h10]
MELSELSSTQPRVQAQKILVDAQGNSLKINLQSVELEGRPKLVRTLKNSGALVVSFTKEADIILVDSTTESGKRLIRTWGHDSHNVVLEHTWARSSIDAGRPLLEADNWGGAMTVDDGKPVTIDGVVVDEDELEEVEALVTKSPLPTPRVTPVDPTPQQLDHIDLDPPASNTSPVPPPPEPTATQTTAVNPFLAEESMESTHHDTSPMPPQQSQQPPPASQALPYSQPGSFVQPPQSQNAYPYPSFVPQHVSPSSQSQIKPQQFPHTTFPSSQLQMIQAVPHTPFPSAQPHTIQMGSEATYNGVNFQPQNFAAVMAIMDVVRHMDQSAWLGQNQMPLTQPPANHNPSPFFLQPQMNLGPTMNGAHTPSLSTHNSQAMEEFEPAAIDPFLTTSLGHSNGGSASTSFEYQSSAEYLDSRHSTRKSQTKSFHSQLPDEALTPSVSRGRPPAVKPTNPPRRSRKGKEKAVSPESSEDCRPDELAPASSDSSSPINPSTSPPTQPRKVTAHKQKGEIFLSESGQPLQFFVQVDLHGRHNVVSNIKKNKGKIVNNIADADYLILFTRSDTFQGLLSEASALGKSPIQAAFVADCIEEGDLLDEAGYMLEPGAKLKTLKRGRRQNVSWMKSATPEAFRKTNAPNLRSSSAKTKMTISLSQTPTKDDLDNKAKTTPRSAVSSTSKSTSLSKLAWKEEVVTPSRSTGSPTPPPPETRKLMKNGKYLFTEVEDEYFLHLAKHHLNHDPSTSNTALVHKLHKKMPHHPFASWQAHIDKKMKRTLDDIRKRANIAKRKNVTDTTTPNTRGRLLEEDEPGPSKRPRFGPSKSNNDISLLLDQPAVQDPEREDFEVITKFFASGGGDDDDDERVWQELDKHRPCRTASSWPEYYAVHQTEVYMRIEELMNERAGE